MGRIEAILLAAGYSSRMGRLKPLLPIGGTTVIRRQAEVLDGLTDRTIVVTGYRGDEVEAHLSGSRVTTVRNQAFAEGMFTSVKAGILALDQEVSAVLILPAGNTVADRRSDRGIPPLGRSRPVSLFFNAERPSSCDLGRLHSGYTVLSGRCGTKRSTDTI